jgi:hypothetical protein
VEATAGAAAAAAGGEGGPTAADSRPAGPGKILPRKS